MTRRDDANDRTRRAFLGTTATLAALGLAGCSGDGDGGDGAGGGSTPTDEPMSTPMPTATPTDTMAPMTDAPTDTPTDTESPTVTEAMAAPDVPLLNYALTLEHLENAFYREGLEQFSDEQLMNADALSEFGDEVRMALPGHLETVGAHEAAHVSALSDTVEQLGGTPVSEAEYDFGYETPSEFLAVAKALENTGVAAYKGAAPTVSNDAVFSAAIGIHSVEARHAALLNEVNATSPFPAGVDEPLTMAEVTEIAGQFIVEE
jgi:rubrerythrin